MIPTRRPRRAAVHRPAPPVTVVAVVAMALVCACSAPEDSDDYEYGEPDATSQAALLAACDDEHPCGGELECVVPHECALPDDAPDDFRPTGEGGIVRDRCDAGRPCMDGLVCQPTSSVGVCTRDCVRDEDCPEGGACWTSRGAAYQLCVRPEGRVGDPCDVENDCYPGLFCENRAKNGYCSAECAAGLPCPAGMDTICTRLSQGFGNYCLRLCDPEGMSCEPAGTCTKMTQSNYSVCFPTF